MALVKCRECKGDVSDSAKTCPNCGIRAPAPRPVPLAVCLIILASVVLPLVGGMGKEHVKGADSERRAPTRTERIEREFSAWDGSHRGLNAVILSRMNDPDSFQHVKTIYRDEGDHLLVSTLFRGKNAFGGVVANMVQAKTDLNGNVLEILVWQP